MLFCPSCADGFEYESWMLKHIKEEHPQRYINMMVQRELEREKGERGDDDYP